MSLKCDCDWLCVQAKGGDVWQGLELGQDPDWIWDGGGAREEATGTSLPRRPHTLATAVER